jgi:fructose/tagatose bisphosphate aldolase
VNTELRVAYKEGIESEMKEKPAETTPYKILAPAFEEVKKVVMEKIKLFRSENKI